MIQQRDRRVVVTEKVDRGQAYVVPLTFPDDADIADYSFAGEAREHRGGDGGALATFDVDVSAWPDVVASITIPADAPDRIGADLWMAYQGSARPLIAWDWTVQDPYTAALPS